MTGLCLWMSCGIVTLCIDILGLSTREDLTMPNYEVYYSKATGHYLIKVTSPMFRPSQVVLTSDQYLRFKAWLNGSKLIQEALPDLSADDREILMTGCGPKE